MLKIKRTTLVIAAVITAFPAIAFAGATEDITRLTSEIAVLEARLKHVSIEADIAKKQAEVRASTPSNSVGIGSLSVIGSPSPIPPQPTPPMSLSERLPPPSSLSAKTLADDEAGMYVSGIEGYGGEMSAFISYGKGRSFQVRLNDEVNEGWIVSLIEPSAVTFRREIFINTAKKSKGKGKKEPRIEKMRISFGVEPMSKSTSESHGGLMFNPGRM